MGSRAWYGTESEEIDSVVQAGSKVDSMRNKEFGVRSTRTAYLTKMLAGEIGRNREKLDDFAMKRMGCEYEFGDMVWGKVKSHPWWPGQVFNEALSVSCVQKTKREGHVLVAFFGDSSYGWLHPTELVPFDENYVEKSKQTNERAFQDAVEEAEYEISRRAALGLSCPCGSASDFRPLCLDGFFEVDIRGYETRGMYTVQQIKNNRIAFQSVKMLDFLKQLASMPFMIFKKNVPWIKNEATVLAYRRAVFEKYDKTYTDALGAKPLLPVNSRVVLARLAKAQYQDLLSDPLKVAEFGINHVASADPAKSNNGKSALDLPPASKPPKKRLRPDDYANVTGHGSIITVKEMSSEGLGKPNEHKSLSVETKVGNEKPLKLQDKVWEETHLKVPSKPIKNSIKKVETPRRVAKPTILLIEFPRQSALPSVSELKARFVRFGPFHHSPRVFWKSSTCWIVFKFESGAQAARRYAIQNRFLFGDLKVLYDVQPLQAPATVVSKSAEHSLEESFDKVQQLTSVNTSDSTEARSKEPWEQQLAKVHPKSCLKKQWDDGSKSIMRSRVKFRLGEDESDTEEQPAIDMSMQTNCNHPSDISSSSIAALDDAKNLKKVELPLPLWIPVSRWISTVPENHEVHQFAQACNQEYLQLGERKNHISTTVVNTDVSGAMLELLTRCSAILAELKNSLGYVPYHLS